MYKMVIEKWWWSKIKASSSGKNVKAIKARYFKKYDCFLTVILEN